MEYFILATPFAVIIIYLYRALQNERFWKGIYKQDAEFYKNHADHWRKISDNVVKTFQQFKKEQEKA